MIKYTQTSLPPPRSVPKKKANGASQPNRRGTCPPKHASFLGFYGRMNFKSLLGALAQNLDPQGIGEKTSPEMFSRKIILHHSIDRGQNFYV